MLKKTSQAFLYAETSSGLAWASGWDLNSTDLGAPEALTVTLLQIRDPAAPPECSFCKVGANKQANGSFSGVH